MVQIGDVVYWGDKPGHSAVVKGNLWEKWNLISTLTRIERDGVEIWRLR